MRMKILCASILAFPIAASAQLTAIPEFTGEYSEDWSTTTSTGFPPCLTPDPFEGRATLCSGGAHVTGGWGFRCSITPYSGTRLFGSSSGPAVYTFAEPISRFGGQFGTNALQPGEPTDLGTVEFYDEFGGLIGQDNLELNDTCDWVWHGWESSEPVFSIIVRGSVFGGAYVMMDAMQIDLDSGTPTCYADCDGNGELDFFDFLCFQNEFSAGSSYADCDGSGELDFFDFLCFQNEFSAGCP